MSVYCECCVLSVKGLCDGLIPRLEESYRLCCIIVCDLETSSMRRPWPTLGSCARKNNVYDNNVQLFYHLYLTTCTPHCSVSKIYKFNNILSLVLTNILGAYNMFPQISLGMIYVFLLFN
jgi:hypothetical protein